MSISDDIFGFPKAVWGDIARRMVNRIPDATGWISETVQTVQAGSDVDQWRSMVGFLALVSAIVLYVIWMMGTSRPGDEFED